MRLHAALCALLALASAPARAQEAPAEDASSAPVEEIQILGERPGPQLWKITNGEHTLWLLGLLQPLPKRMQWKSGAVEQVLDESQEVIASGAAVGARIGPIKLYRLYRQWRGLRVNPNEQTLADVLPPPLYARFETLRVKYAPRDRDMAELRPIFAAGALFQAAVDRVGLTTENDVHDRVEKLAKKRDLPIRQVKLMLENPSDTLGALGDIPLAQEIACLETTIARLETDVDAMRVRATAWADGDIDAFKAAAYPDQQQACWNAIGSAGEIKPLIEQAQRDWLAFFDAALASSKVSLAMQSMDRVLAPDGVLAHARSQGYEVRGPE
ncbi:MAG: TraB/GumN family protein [Deltaproteobacteria bacterium]|nr:TraB/GumN family protein [Deltaproteobacteria bacterium]